MDKQFLFTNERLSKLPIPESGREEYFDSKQQKLRLRITSTGAISFAVVKRVNDKPKRVTIGKWPEVTIAKARDEAIKILDDIRKGKDPVAEKRKKKLSNTKLAEVLEQYIDERDLKPYTIENYRYKLKLGFSDWLDLPVVKISQDMVLKRHKVLSQKGKTTANTTMRVLRLTLNYAQAVGMIDHNPTEILSKARLWHKNKRKDRTIPTPKLRDWHEAVDALKNQKAKVYLYMLVYMGIRGGEARKLRWQDVDLKQKLIIYKDTKNRTDHKLPISIPVFHELKKLKVDTGHLPWVFPNVNGNGPMSLPSKPIRSVIKASGCEFSSHDCRRTFSTIAEKLHIPETMLKRLINHVTTNNVTGGYIVTEEETLREALKKIADYIQAQIKQDGNVIYLQGQQA